MIWLCLYGPFGSPLTSASDIRNACFLQLLQEFELNKYDEMLSLTCIQLLCNETNSTTKPVANWTETVKREAELLYQQQKPQIQTCDRSKPYADNVITTIFHVAVARLYINMIHFMIFTWDITDFTIQQELDVLSDISVYNVHGIIR